MAGLTGRRRRCKGSGHNPIKMDSPPRAVKRAGPSQQPKPPQPMIRQHRLAAIVLLGLGLGACAPEIHFRGNAPAPDRLALVKPGAQTREQVIRLLGSPTSVATFDQNTILYIGQKTKTVAFQYPEVLERTVVAITFGENGRVQEIGKFSLKDGKVVQLVDRTTPTPGRQFSIMQQLIGNIGKFESNQKLGPGGGL